MEHSDALGWLLELEMVDNPIVIHALVLNIYKVSKAIKNIEFVLDTKNKKLLIYLELNWRQWFVKRTTLVQAIYHLLLESLPNFGIRVVFDRVILEKAAALMRP